MEKEKLKTLKDIDEMQEMGLVRVDDFKAEAVKWIYSEKAKRMSAIDFILVFFDLTEEDLE